jgi:hypothetical protein
MLTTPELTDEEVDLVGLERGFRDPNGWPTHGLA